MYDLIGDIHGYATPLKHLLNKLGYTERDGVWQHPERQVVFLGDFVDRGPEQVETVRIARAMVEAGQALAVMGNHEFNAVAWATEDPEAPSQYLRSHSDKNRNQHQAFLDQVGQYSEQHRDMIDWFRTLPLYLDLDGLRVIHACWHPPSLENLRDYTDEQQRILKDAWPALCRKGTVPYDALETTVKGLEVPLPQGHRFFDKDGNPRHHIRTRWWELERLTYSARATGI
ncbi:metallophosphoesterase [Halomonas sp. Bachu 37]|uniref:metallophosphoesterase n=1 Tax=Halomonas kashgarensis TaxID=3084920 RepID=UPI003216A0AA